MSRRRMSKGCGPWSGPSHVTSWTPSGWDLWPCTPLRSDCRHERPQNCEQTVTKDIKQHVRYVFLGNSVLLNIVLLVSEFVRCDVHCESVHLLLYHRHWPVSAHPTQERQTFIIKHKRNILLIMQIQNKETPQKCMLRHFNTIPIVLGESRSL